jgi:hypothetical protein
MNGIPAQIADRAGLPRFTACITNQVSQSCAWTKRTSARAKESAK